MTAADSNELAEEHGLAATVPFKVYYPNKRIAKPGAASDETRYYKLNGHPAYVVVIAQGGLGQYYDLQGTTWSDPPILRDPDQTIHLAGRTMQLYFEGQRLRVVAWRDGGGVYWLVNTLQNILTNKQMLAIAAAAKAGSRS